MSYYGGPQYGAPQYGGGYGGPPPPQFRPPPGPPPPLPPGWIQEWEPSARRAFFVETATGRSQWEPPYGPPGGYDGSRGGPGGYYAPPPGPPPGYGGGGYPQQGAMVVEERRSDGTGKMIAAGVGGLAVGALAGGLIEHEIGT